MNSFPLKAVEAQPRRIMRVVKGAVACKVRSLDRFTPRVPDAWTGTRPVHMLATSDEVMRSNEPCDCEATSGDDGDCCAKADANQLCKERALQLCQLSVERHTDTLLLRVFHTWKNFTIATCAQAWCEAVYQEKDDIERQLAKMKESQQEEDGDLKTKMQALDRCRAYAENQLQSANSTVKHLWQELGHQAKELRQSRVDNRILRQKIEDLNSQLSNSLSSAATMSTENAVLKAEVSTLEAEISKLQLACVVCMGACAVIAFSPCGHLATCEACARKLNSRECPICRKCIVQELHVFIP